MTVAAAPIAAELGSKVGGGAINALPKPKTNHPYIVGLILVAIGVVGMVGSITGQLPAMIAALFDPNVLTDESDNSPGIVGVITKAEESVVDPASLLGGLGGLGNVL